jgi:hypothetical protein
VTKKTKSFVIGAPHRRRASDRARERAGRAAYLGDRAGLLIATSVAAALMSSRTEAEQTMAGQATAPAAAAE